MATQVRSEAVKKWIEVGKILEADSKEVVTCPICEKGTLQIRDVPYAKDASMIDRHMTCDACGAKNYVRMKPKK